MLGLSGVFGVLALGRLGPNLDADLVRGLVPAFDTWFEIAIYCGSC
jgi:hypothetical protein